LELNAAQTPQVAELAPILEGKPDVTQISRIELEQLAREFRTQCIIFETARNVFDQIKQSWKGSREILLAQLVRIVEQFIRSDRILISPPLFYQDELRRRLIITLNMSRIVQHVCEAVRQENTERLTPIFDRDHPIRSTGQMRTWYTSNPANARASHTSTSVSTIAPGRRRTPFVLDNSQCRERLGKKRPSGLRGALRLSWRGAEVSARFSCAACQWRHAHSGNEGTGH
jgi:type III restriction enzyme